MNGRLSFWKPRGCGYWVHRLERMGLEATPVEVPPPATQEDGFVWNWPRPPEHTLTLLPYLEDRARGES